MTSPAADSRPTEWIAVLDFGSQYTRLIARRIRELGVFSELVHHDVSAGELRERRPAGIVLSGGPRSVKEGEAPRCDPGLLELGVPVLGICYGMQLMAVMLGGEVTRGERREYGPARVKVREPDVLFRDLPEELEVWMSHGDRVARPPEGFAVLAGTDDCPVAAMGDLRRRLFGLQFHPEVVHTPRGREILHRFLYDACGCRGTWSMPDFIHRSVEQIRKRVGSEHVLCGLSGGVDSSVTAALVHRAVGDQLHCVFVDTGLLRAGEAAEVKEVFEKGIGMDLHVVDAAELFFQRLRGVTDPEEKRRIIGATFIDVFSAEARRLGRIRFLAQGTLYPDVIESRSPTGGPSATIKSHHNVGGLPPDLQFELIEPLRDLFKDEVREIGRRLGLPEHIVQRQPFPGPGLAVRIIGEVTPQRVRILQEADRRVQEEIRKLPDYERIWQSFAVLLPVQTVGVMGDERTYENVVALRVVESADGMTADWVHLPYETLERISARIINEVRGVNRVVYDITSKPPGTIEWE